MRKLGLFLTTLVSVAFLGGAARAEELGMPVPDIQLDAMRGGFITAGGFIIGFGAETRTFVDGRLVLQTNLTLNDRGVTVTQQGDPAVLQSGAAAQAAALAAGLNLEGLLPGATISTLADGRTAFVQRVDGGALQNFIINRADGLDLRQDTAVTLTLPGFDVFQQQLNDGRLGFQLGQDLGVALGGLTAR